MLDLSALYGDHIKQLISDYQTLMVEHDFEYLIIASGETRYKYLDDRDYPFSANPQFNALIPLHKLSDSFIVLPQNGKPYMIYYQPRDYWHPVPCDPQGIWVEHFNISIVRSSSEAIQAFPNDLSKAAYIGELNHETSTIETFASVNPEEFVNQLHWRRAYKSAYEAECIKEANIIAARAHQVAKDVFYSGGSELDIHYAYTKTCAVLESELPYTNIIAINEHAAVLHYTEMQAENIPNDKRLSFLIDAGMTVYGYTSDITRTYAFNKGEFADLITAFDILQQNIISSISVGSSFVDLHIATHLKIAELLKSFDFVNMSPESMVESGISSIFYPHGLGHLLGLQVHDIGGHLATPTGTIKSPPSTHKYLRLTRNIENHMIFTIEPGLYFIDMLLNECRNGKYKSAINWSKIEKFQPYGGIRIEDDVLISNNNVANLTRQAFNDT